MKLPKIILTSVLLGLVLSVIAVLQHSDRPAESVTIHTIYQEAYRNSCSKFSFKSFDHQVSVKDTRVERQAVQDLNTPGTDTHDIENAENKISATFTDLSFQDKSNKKPVDFYPGFLPAFSNRYHLNFLPEYTIALLFPSYLLIYPFHAFW